MISRIQQCGPSLVVFCALASGVVCNGAEIQPNVTWLTEASLWQTVPVGGHDLVVQSGESPGEEETARPLGGHLLFLQSGQSEDFVKFLIDQRPLDERPLDERPLDERPLDERPLDERPLDERPLDERPLDERPLDERPLDERPLDERPLFEPPPPAVPPPAPAVPPAPQSPSDSDEVRGVQNDESEAADTETYGEAPVDTSYAFLRRISPLLPPGKSQFDTGFVYSLYENRRSVYLDYVSGPDEVVDARLLRRTLYVPFAYRYGVADGVQLFANLPVGWSKNEVAFPGYDAVDNVGWIGDVTVGVVCVLGEPSPGDPDTIGSLALTAPTGNTTFLTNFLEPEAQMGLGHFALSASLTSIRTIDPLVVFHGFGVVYQFDDKFHGRTIHVQPGMAFNYRLGVGFAVNNKVTLSSAVLGAYVLTSKINNERLPQSTLEPIRMRFAVTIADGESLQEPFIQIGVTDDANTATLGWVVTY